MRFALALALWVILLGLPTAAAAHPIRSAIFFYPWYSTSAHDGEWAHWQQSGHAPPFDIASAFYPARGAYSSADPRVLRAQMHDLARAGIDEVVSSWWGRGSPEDVRLGAVQRAAQRAGVEVAVQLEPYQGRTMAAIAADLPYLRAHGVHDVYVYRAGDFTAAAWRTLNLALDGMRVFAQTGLVGLAARSGFTGIYTYDILIYAGSKFARLCAQARAVHILCAPSVGPGYDAAPATGDLRVKPRNNGRTYDSMWRAALQAGADIVTITSYNEWSEGTQIEPAGHGGRFQTYDGAYGLHGRLAQWAYIRETADWTAVLRTR
jgi:glycoprotein endo-alpha-1,2-mannosidase